MILESIIAGVVSIGAICSLLDYFLRGNPQYEKKKRHLRELAKEIRKIKLDRKKDENILMRAKRKKEVIASMMKILDESDEEILEMELKRLAEHNERIKRDMQERSQQQHDGPSDHSKKGFLYVEVLVYVIPAMISLCLVGTFIYLIINNQSTPDYKCPEELRSGLSTVLGFYFGMGASKIVK